MPEDEEPLGSSFNFTGLPYDIQCNIFRILPRRDLLRVIEALEHTCFAIPDGAIMHIKSPNDDWPKGALINIVDIDCQKNEWDYPALIRCLPNATNHICLQGWKCQVCPLNEFLEAREKLASLEVITELDHLWLSRLEINFPMVISGVNSRLAKITFFNCDASAPVTVIKSRLDATGDDWSALEVQRCTSNFYHNLDISGIYSSNVFFDGQAMELVELRDKTINCETLKLELDHCHEIRDCVFLAEYVVIDYDMYPRIPPRKPTVHNVQFPNMTGITMYIYDCLPEITNLHAPALENVSFYAKKECDELNLSIFNRNNSCLTLDRTCLKPLYDLHFSALKCLVLWVPVKDLERITHVFPKLETLAVICSDGATVIPTINAPVLRELDMVSSDRPLQQGTLQESLDRYPKLDHLKLKYDLHEDREIFWPSNHRYGTNVLEELKSVSTKLKSLILTNVLLSPEIFERKSVSFPELLHLDVKVMVPADKLLGAPLLFLKLDAPKLQRLLVLSQGNFIEVGYFPRLKEVTVEGKGRYTLDNTTSMSVMRNVGQWTDSLSSTEDGR